MPAIHVMLKPASGNCNMRCTYCFYTDEMANRKQSSYGIMTEATLEAVIRETLRFAESECTIAFQGGEPTLAGLPFFIKCMELEQQYNEKQVTIHHALQTNGYALDERWCQFLRENHFLVGISMDGIQSTHDCYRKDYNGEGTYFRVLEAVKLLEQYQVEFNILTVVNGKTAPKIRRIYEKYHHYGFHYQQYIPCLDPLGEQPIQKEYSLTPELYGQFLIDLFDLWFQDYQKGQQPYIRQFENWIGVLMGIPPEACDQRGMCGCQNIVEADGTVYPCDFYVLDDYRLGNLNSQSFQEIYQNRTKLQFIEQSVNRDPGCGTCLYLQVCRGGCRRHRDSGYTLDGGHPTGNKNRFCQSYQMFFDRWYPTMVQIARECKRSVDYSKV